MMGAVTASARTDAVVIGSGVIGASIALELARAGRNVTVVDKGPAAGAGSTSSSSAVIRYTYSTWDGVVTAWESHFMWDRWAEHLGVVDPDGMARFFKVGMVILDMPGFDRARSLQLLERAGVPYEEWDADTISARMPAMDAGRYWPPRLPSDAAFWEPAAGRLGAFFTPDAGFVDDPQLAAHNLMVAAKANGAEFRFRREVVKVDVGSGRVDAVELADGDRIETPVVINAAGPFSARVNEMAGVLDDFKVRTRPLRQEVHAIRAPATFTVDDRGAVVADGDLGTYFRPHPGGTVLIGGVEAECDPLTWVDDAETYDEQPTVPIWEAQVYRVARRLPDVEVPPQPARPRRAVRRLRRLDSDLRPHRPRRLLRRHRHERQPVQERADGRALPRRAGRRMRGGGRPRRRTAARRLPVQRTHRRPRPLLAPAGSQPRQHEHGVGLSAAEPHAHARGDAPARRYFRMCHPRSVVRTRRPRGHHRSR